MHVVTKFILGAAALIITILLLYTSLPVFSKSKTLSDQMIEEQDRTLSAVREYDVMKYDGYTINGSMAINYIKNVVNTHDIIIEVHGVSSDFVIAETSDFTLMRDIDSEKYINPLKEFLCFVRRDANDVITKIELTEVP